MNTATPLAPDAAVALGIAATAMPFARTPEDEAERWLRVLRLHGQAGIALQALGVSEGPLQGAAAEHPSAAAAGASPAPPVGGDRDVVTEVTTHAATIADRRGTAGVGTRDLLAAVIELYGEHFDRVLRAHGTDSGEVLERIAA